MTDAERLAERLRELLERATPGPWQQKYAKGYGMAQIWSDNASKKNDWNSDFVPGTIAYQCDEDGPGLGFDCDIQPQCATDAELIVEAVNGLPTLLARIAALEDALRDCSSGLEYIRQHYGELSGVGFDRALTAAAKALGKGSE